MSNKLEIAMRQAGRLLAHHQLAKLYKIPEEMQQTPVDFIGHDAKGRCILIECKMVKRISLSIGKSPGLLPHQWAALMDGQRAGALSLIAWMRSADEAVCKVFSAGYALKISEGRKSINWYDIDNKFVRSMIGKDFELNLLSYWLPINDNPSDHTVHGVREACCDDGGHADKP